MSVILEAKIKLIRVRRAIYAIIREEAIKNSEFISDLNRSQLEKGERADESVLPNYSPVSVNQFGKPPGSMRLFDTGDFYEGIKPIFDDDGFDLTGLDEKTTMLVERYGEMILGLNDENKQLLANMLVPGIIQRIRRYFL